MPRKCEATARILSIIRPNLCVTVLSHTLRKSLRATAKKASLGWRGLETNKRDMPLNFASSGGLLFWTDHA